MKTKNLLLTLFAIFGFTVANAVTINICGNISNLSSSIKVHYTVTDSLSTYSDSITVNSSGSFCDSLNVIVNTGTVDIWFIDCNGDTVNVRGYYTSNTLRAIFSQLDYCPGTNPSNCSAAFAVTQDLDSLRQPIPWALRVLNNSTGAGLTYTWDFGDGTTGTGANLSHTYSGNGPYNLCLMVDDGNGCRDTFCDSISIDSNGMKLKKEGFQLVIGEGSTSSVDELESGVSLNLYPNPAGSSVTLELNVTTSTDAEITIIDVSGKVVAFAGNFELSQGNQKVNLDVSSLPTGIYYVRVSSTNGVVTKKLLIE